MPRLVACGGRATVFNDFVTAHQNKHDAYFAMWLDSEDPMANTEDAWNHLRQVTTVAKWKQPNGAGDEQVLFMTTCMETWVVADREILKKHCGSRLQESALPPLDNLEQRSRHEIQDNLIHATRNCSNAFEKGKRSYEILGKLTPVSLNKLPSFVRVIRILNERLPADVNVSRRKPAATREAGQPRGNRSRQRKPRS